MRTRCEPLRPFAASGGGALAGTPGSGARTLGGALGSRRARAPRPRRGRRTGRHGPTLRPSHTSHTDHTSACRCGQAPLGGRILSPSLPIVGRPPYGEPGHSGDSVPSASRNRRKQSEAPQQRTCARGRGGRPCRRSRDRRASSTGRTGRPQRRRSHGRTGQRRGRRLAGGGDRQGRLHPRQGRRRPAAVRRGRLRSTRRRTRPTPTSTSTPPTSAPDPASSSAAGVAAVSAPAGPSPTPSPTRASTSSAPCCGPRSTSEGDLTSVNGYAAPDLSLSVDPRISAADAAERAVGPVREDPPAHEGETADLTGIAPRPRDLVVYRMGSTKGEAGKAVLAWQVEVTNDDNVRDVVFLDAQTGKPSTATRWCTTPSTASSTRRPAPATRPPHPGVAGGRPVPGHPQRRPAERGQLAPASPTGSSRTPSVATPTTARAPDDARSTTTRGSAAPTPTGTASPPTTATASPPTTSSRTSGATPTPSTPPA